MNQNANTKVMLAGKAKIVIYFNHPVDEVAQQREIKITPNLFLNFFFFSQPCVFQTGSKPFVKNQ